MTELINQLVLGEMRVVKLAAEAKRTVDPQRELNTHVEVKLTPLQVEQEATFVVRAQLVCNGTQTKPDPESNADATVFSIDCLLQLTYRQVRGAQIDFGQFQSSHMQLNRQIYPLLIAQVQPLLSQLGLHQVRLPVDMLQIKSDVPPDQGSLH